MYIYIYMQAHTQYELWYDMDLRDDEIKLVSDKFFPVSSLML